MTRSCSVPPELSYLNLKYVRRISNDEMSSACPKCGGDMHRNGEFPDRLRIFLKSKTTGGLLCWCRRCGFTATPKGERLDPDRQKAWIEERKVIELEQRSKVEHALEILRRERLWITYHENLTKELRFKFYERGIDDIWIDYWNLGYNPDKVIWDREQEKEYHTPALTIPVFEPMNNQPVTIRNRLLNPIDPMDKYRPEYSGLPACLYFTDYDKMPTDRALIVEGEFKAMTTYLAIDDPSLTVVGIPGKSPNMEMLKALDDCELVYICLDPDAYEKRAGESVTPVRRLVDHFKDKSRIISLPGKIDDMIMAGTLTKKVIWNLMTTARRVQLTSLSKR